MAIKLPIALKIVPNLFKLLAIISSILAILLTIFFFSAPASFKPQFLGAWWLTTALESGYSNNSSSVSDLNPFKSESSRSDSASEILSPLVNSSSNEALDVLLQSDLDQLRECTSNHSNTSGNRCPAYFGWIRNDLAPWKESGITRETLETARSKADFRLVIVNGSMYMTRYNKCFESRDDYTLWGMLMLLQEYPGQVPDVELLFNCGDWPLLFRYDHVPNTSSWPPPPLFLYCTTKRDHYDIVFPDWSYWGWPEVNISPWSIERERIFSGAQELEWSDREPIAHWKGNYHMGPARADLIKCTVNNTQNFSLVTQHQDWGAEREHNFQNSTLSKQCKQRYKVYVQGGGWSVSLKYIMSCGSTMLQIEPMFQEFFARSTIPFVHFWPVNRTDICNSIKFAVDWGNAHPQEAEAIGKCGQAFLEREVSMKYVYQYMLHLLQEYAKLLKFKPEVPEGVEAMSLKSDLPGHELTMPKNMSHTPETICLLPDEVSEDDLLAAQVQGYQRILNTTQN